MSNFIRVNQLKEALSDENLVVVDVRQKFESFQTGETAYQDSHIPGATYLDFRTDLTGENSFLPPVEEFVEKLKRAGIANDSKVVFYDEGNQVAASKGWFLLHYLGHDQVYVLDGGFPAWLNASGPVTNELPQKEKTDFSVSENPNLVLHMEDIKNRMGNQDSVVIDSRSYQRFIGEEEPKYKKAGRIPGAVNYFSKHVFNEEGLWKTKSELAAHFEPLKEKEEIVVSCGAGNAACLNLIALKEAGFDQVKIYPGGFSEWIEDEHNEIETGP